MLILHVFWIFPSEIARNKLLFSDHKQQSLEFVIEGAAMFGVVIGVAVVHFIHNGIYKEFENLNLLSLVIAIKYQPLRREKVHSQHLVNDSGHEN